MIKFMQQSTQRCAYRLFCVLLSFSLFVSPSCHGNSAQSTGIQNVFSLNEMRHTEMWSGQDGTGRDGTCPHLTGQSSSSLGVFEGETLQRVVTRPLAPQLLVKTLLILHLQHREHSQPSACWLGAISCPVATWLASFEASFA